MSSERDVQRVVNAAEKSSIVCWEILAAWKYRPRKAPPDLLAFQPTLFRALLSIQSLYVRISRESDELIARKNALPRAQFAARLKRLHSYQSTLRDALVTGKALGDAFAWFFYRRSQDVLARHLDTQRQLFVPVGIGGKTLL